jgi:hypothetical protein
MFTRSAMLAAVNRRTQMKKSMIALVVFGATLAGCGSGIGQAKQEMAESCFSSGNGRLTESECACMADKAFETLNSEERAFIDKLYSLERGVPDAEAAERLGMERSEFNRLSRAYMGKVRDGAIGAARQCVGA